MVNYYNQSQLQNKQKTLQDSITSFSNLPTHKQMIVVGIIGGILSITLPILIVTIPVGVAYATLFLVLKTVWQMANWMAKKLFEVGKYSIEKINKGTNYVAEKTKNGYDCTIDSIKNNSSQIAYKASEKLYKVSGDTDYVEKLIQLTEDQRRKSEEVKKEINAIADVKTIKQIISKIRSSIEYQITEKKETTELNEQKKFMNVLGVKRFKNLLTAKRILPKDSYFIYSIFSDHYEQIKELIEQCKKDRNPVKVLKTEKIKEISKLDRYGQSKSVDNEFIYSNSNSSLISISDNFTDSANISFSSNSGEKSAETSSKKPSRIYKHFPESLIEKLKDVSQYRNLEASK